LTVGHAIVSVSLYKLKGQKGKKEEEIEERIKIWYLKKGLVTGYERSDERKKET
jgi:hypothetical protein